MHKILGFVALAINCYAWLSTFESNRTFTRNKRPEIRQLLDKQKALALVDQQKSEATSLLASPAGAPPSESDDQILAGHSLLSGEMQGESQGREYRYLVEIKFTKSAADSLEPNQWKALVIVMNSENLHHLNVFKSKPKIQSGVITLELEESDKDQVLSYQSNHIPVNLKRMVISIDNKGLIQSGVEDEYGNRWKSRVSKLDIKSVVNLVGDWKGNFPNGTPGNIKIDLEGEIIKGTVEYNHQVGVCRGKLSGFPHEGGQVILVGGSINDHSACISNFVIRFKAAENSLVGAFYDYSTTDVNEFRFQR